MRGVRAVAALLPLLFAGCAPALSYAEDRLLDLADPVKLGLGYGVGLNLSLEPTELLRAGIGVSNEVRAGWEGRVLGSWAETEWGVLLAYAHYRGRLPRTPDGEEILGPADGSAEWELVVVTPLWGRLPDAAAWAPAGVRKGTPPVRWLDVEAAATLLVPSVRIGFSPGEVADLLVGFLALDLADDDGRSPRAPGARERWIRDLSNRDLRIRERALRRLEEATGKKAPRRAGFDPVEAAGLFR